MSLSNRSLIKGIYLPPGDKSISHRILILTGQIIGKSVISNLLEGEDVINTLKAMRLLGAQFKKQYEAGLISGQGTLNCLWEHSSELADHTAVQDPEFPFYLALVVFHPLTKLAMFQCREVISIEQMFGNPTNPRQSLWKAFW